MVVFFFVIFQLLSGLVLLPEGAYFLFKFKRAIICRKSLTRISYEFVGHFASLGTHKYTNNATATYKHYERRVEAEELIERYTNPYIKKYLFLRYAATANLLSPLNCTTKSIYDAMRGYRRCRASSSVWLVWGEVLSCAYLCVWIQINMKNREHFQRLC